MIIDAISKLQKLTVGQRLLACIAAGALMTLALPPINLWPFMFIGLSLFYILMQSFEGARLRTGFFAGWCFGFGYFGAGLWWIANALLVEGNDFSWVWPLAIVGLPALLAFFPAFACLPLPRFARLKTIPGLLLFITLLALSEWLRGHAFTGFPWNTYGYVWSGWLSMLQSTSLGGAYALTLVTLFWACVPGFIALWPATRKQKIILGSVVIVTMALNSAYGLIRLHNNPTQPRNDVNVKVVQPDIRQNEKWDPDRAAENFTTLLELTQSQEETAPLTIVVWPETALSFRVLDFPLARQALRDTLSSYQRNVYLVTGFLRHENTDDYNGDGLYYNSLAVINRFTTIQATYDKSHLVPFGEYIPFENILAMTPFVPFTGFREGAGPTTLQEDSIPPFSPLICYEVIFPGAVKSQSAQEPEWMVNVTNDAWYGDSPGPYQHFAQTRIRAIEEGLPTVRAANTGISGVIDPVGRVVSKSGVFEQSALVTPLPKALPGRTLYYRWGDKLFFIMLATSAILAFALKRRHPR